MDAYKVPRGERQRLPIKNCASLQDKLTKRTFFDVNTDRTKQVPGSKYLTQWKWAQNDGVGRPKGKFMTSEKVTMTAERMKEAKKVPACNKYDLSTWKKIAVNTKTLGFYNNSSERTVFIDEVVHHSKQIPATNRYNQVNVEFIKDRVPKTIISNKGKQVGLRSKRITRDSNEPSMQTYDVAKAWDKTQYSTIINAGDKQKKVSHIDKITKNNSFVPGVGTYFNDKDQKKKLA